MRSLFIVILIFSGGCYGFSQNLYPELFDGSGGIVNSYGAWGTENYIREPGIDVPGKGTITFYHPDTAPVQQATVFFISGWGRDYTSYDRFFKYVAGLGYNVVNIYNLNPGNIQVSYQNSLDMMQLAVNTYNDWIDTGKVALMGHSYGGGSTIWLGKQIFDPNGLNWGNQGRFIMVFAPWLSFLVTDTDLQNYPAGVKLLMLQSYDDFHYGGPTYNTDPRALRAVYELINIPDSEKDFITMFSDQNPAHTYVYNGQTFSYIANHYVCYTDLTDGNNNPYDALDVYSSNRLFNAMAEYVFEGNTGAKNVALGNGSNEQKDMGTLPDLAVTDYYVTTRPESVFEYKCSENTPGTWGDPAIWKLQDYCEDSDGDGLIDALQVKEEGKMMFTIYPVPATGFIHIKLFDKYQKIEYVDIKNVDGKTVLKFINPLNNDFDISVLPAGIYFIHIKTKSWQAIQKLIITS